MDVELSEAWLSEETGIPRDVLRGAREKNLGAADWRKGSRGQIVWELSGLNRCSVEFPEFAGILEKITGGVEGAERALEALEVIEAVVIRKFPNPRLIEAEDGAGARIRVRVHENKNFARGMRIKARAPKVKSMPYQLEGRSPRWPGRF